MRWWNRDHSEFAFKTKREAVAFAKQVEGSKKFQKGNLMIDAPEGAELVTAVWCHTLPWRVTVAAQKVRK